MIISGIHICFVAHLNNMAEAYFFADYEQCLLRTFTFPNLILMTVFTVLTITVRKQYILQHQSSQKYGIVETHPYNYFKLFDNYFPTCFHTELCSWKLMYGIRMYVNAIQVSKGLMYPVSMHNII